VIVEMEKTRKTAAKKGDSGKQSKKASGSKHLQKARARDLGIANPQQTQGKEMDQKKRKNLTTPQWRGKTSGKSAV